MTKVHVKLGSVEWTGAVVDILAFVKDASCKERIQVFFLFTSVDWNVKGSKTLIYGLFLRF